MAKVWIRIISALEIVGGVIGIVFVIWWLSTTPFNLFSLVLAPLPIGIYLLSLTAGVALWRGSSFGRNASIIVQAIQLPKITSPLVIFMFSFGFDAWVHILLAKGSANLGFELRFLAFNQFFINVRDAPIGLGVSIMACIFLSLLVRYKPRAVEEEVIISQLPNSAEWRDEP